MPVVSAEKSSVAMLFPAGFDHGLVAARAAGEGERVVAAAADERVVARAADQGVGALGADQRVVARAANQERAA